MILGMKTILVLVFIFTCMSYVDGANQMVEFMKFLKMMKSQQWNLELVNKNINVLEANFKSREGPTGNNQ